MSIQSWVAIAVTLVTVWALIKRYETRLVLLAAGLFLCCISLDPMYGLDAMGKSMTQQLADHGNLRLDGLCLRWLTYTAVLTARSFTTSPSPIRGLGIFLAAGLHDDHVLHQHRHSVCRRLRCRRRFDAHSGDAPRRHQTGRRRCCRSRRHDRFVPLSGHVPQRLYVANMAHRCREMDFIAYHMRTFSLMMRRHPHRSALLIVRLHPRRPQG